LLTTREARLWSSVDFALMGGSSPLGRHISLLLLLLSGANVVSKWRRNPDFACDAAAEVGANNGSGDGNKGKEEVRGWRFRCWFDVA
jgi:hypothetical protein